MARCARNWVFLGDSLTEGVGSQRISHVSELVNCLGSDHDNPVQYVRLREVDPNGFDRFVKFNLAGFMDRSGSESVLWIWNLGCESRTIEYDFGWMSFISNLRPECVVIFRGSLESIIRPAMINDGSWPWWVPVSWRNYPDLDPRCYFSSTWWRKAKQTSIDKAKQAVRRKLLDLRPGKPLMDLEVLTGHYTSLLLKLREVSAHVLVLGLLPVDDQVFPGSAEHFTQINHDLDRVCEKLGVQFFDWGAILKSLDTSRNFFYRDGFHPNRQGAKALANILHERLVGLAD